MAPRYRCAARITAGGFLITSAAIAATSPAVHTPCPNRSSALTARPNKSPSVANPATSLGPPTVS